MTQHRKSVSDAWRWYAKGEIHGANSLPKAYDVPSIYRPDYDLGYLTGREGRKPVKDRGTG